MEEIMELRCILEEGRIVKQIMTLMLILAAVEFGFFIKSLIEFNHE